VRVSADRQQLDGAETELSAMAGDLRPRPRWLLDMIEHGDVAGLIQTLAGPYAEFAADAAWALGSLGQTECVPPLIAALEHRESLIRRAAAEALGVMGCPEAAPALRKLLSDAEADVRGIAVWSLGGIGDVESVEAIVRLLGDSEFYTDGLGEKELIGWQAAHTLALFGETSYAHLVEASQHQDTVIRRNSAMALGYTCQAAAVEPLSALLADPDTEVRRSALNALGDLGHPVSAAIITPLLTDASEEVRWSAVLLLGNLDEPSAHLALLDALEDPSAEVVSLAAGALASRHAQEAVPRLLRLLGNRGKKAAAAARALGSLGANDSIPLLLEILEGGGDEERAAAAAALGQLKAASAVDSLKRHLADPSLSVRGEVLGALQAITGLSFGETESNRIS
jgi:HEAT repeat protein